MGRLLAGPFGGLFFFVGELMDRAAVFVDAGYVFAQGSALIAGRKLNRGEISLDHEAVIKSLSAFAEGISGLSLLRIYWYDGTSTGPTAQHLTLAHLSNVKVRLGFVNSVGEQKGVDSLIVTDMINLARNRAIADAVLISGDEDLRVGVQQAQEFGIRVHLVGIKPSRGSQSLFLLQEADTTHEWTEREVCEFMKCEQKAVPPVVQVVPNVVVGTNPFESVAAEVASRLDSSELPALIEAYESTRQLPRDIDARLLGGSRSLLRRDLNSDEKKQLRAVFMSVISRKHI
jgi:uncharacterized LabA/DUF88 family protein